LALTNTARLASALINGGEDDIRTEFHRCLDSGITAENLREVVLTSYLFDGYPTALEGFRLLSMVTGIPNSPPPDIKYTGESIALWRTRGEKLCRMVYGKQFDNLTGLVAEFAPELADAMLVEGYGKVLSREKLDPKIRELVVVAILAVKNRPRQLLSHCLGALRLGASEKELRDVIEATAEYSSSDRLPRSTAILEDALRRFVKS